MSGLSEFFGFRSGTATNELPALFPLSILQEKFVAIDVQNIYSKILTDVCERTQGLSEEHQALLWDNCLASESNDGLITLLAKAMVAKQDLFLVFDKATKVLRKANAIEEQQIKADYKTSAESAAGTYISFKNYERSEMIKVYSALEYCTVAALNKSMNLSKAIQLKISGLRGSVSIADSSIASAQGEAIAKGLAKGLDVMLDEKDMIENASPDLTAAQSALLMINQKRSFYLGMPATYITGEAAKGLGDSGLGDAKAVERGLKNYFFSIIKPTLKSIFGTETTFKSEDFQQLATALEAMKTFELTSAEYMSDENKLKIVNKLFGFPEDEKGGPKEKPIEVVPPGGPGNQPPEKNPAPPARSAG